VTTLTSQLDALAAAREGVVAVDRPDLATIELRGADVLRYLHAVCTQDTEGLRPGDAAEALLLSPKGRIEFAFRLAVLAGGVLLDTDGDAAPALAERLARFVFRYDVTVAEPVKGAVSLLGPVAEGALEAAGVRTGPGLLGSHVHLDKGCYPGQETVARVHNLGQVQRRLAGLRFGPAPAGGLPVPPADLVTDDGRRAGQLRSVVDHPELGPIGLAYVRRVVEPGRSVLAGTHPATVVELPFRQSGPRVALAHGD
jgi:tRNA-modifying protein YgfZ